MSSQPKENSHEHQGIVLAAILAAAAGGPALAKSQKAIHHLRQTHALIDTRAAVTAPDPYGVYVQGQEIGRDPDPSIRSSLRDEYFPLQGH